MAKVTYSVRSTGIIFILSGLIRLLFSDAGFAFGQSQQLTQVEFSNDLIRAYTVNDEQLANSLIRDNRFFVKTLVNELIKESLVKELSGKTNESQQAFQIAEKAAASFENIFGEKSLSIGVNYLKYWSKEQKSKKLVADSLYAEGTGLRAKEPEQALGIYQKALSIYRDIGDERGEAEVLGGFGLIYSSSLTDYKTAMAYYQEALIKREKVDDRQLIGNTLNSIGVIHMNSEEYSAAIPFFERAEAIRSEIGDFSNLKRTQSFKAGVYLSLGEEQNNAGRYPESLKNLEKALELNQNLNSNSGVGNVLAQMGFVYSNLGDYETAVEKLGEAIQIMKEEDDTSGLAIAYNHLGIVLQMAGRYEKALEYFSNSLKVYEELADSVNTIALLSNIGTLYFDIKEYLKAEEYLSKALMISREIGSRQHEVNCLLNLANTQSILGKLEESDTNFKSGLKIARSLNNPDLIWRFFVGEAENCQKKGEYERTVEFNDSALKIIDGIRSTLQDEELKAAYLAKERFVFEGVISMLGTLYEKESFNGYDVLAFKYAELSKSRSFLDLLAESLAKIRKTNPRYTDLQYPRTVSLEEVQAMCPDKNTVFLEYSLGDSSSFLWVITRADHHLFRLPDRKTLQEQVESIRFALLDPAKTNNEFIIRGGYSLYRQLVKPAEPYLSKNSKLVIIPDGILNYLPFEVLLTEDQEYNKNIIYPDMPFLVKKYPVSYAQSASVLKSLLAERNKDKKAGYTSKKLIAFGDPVYQSENDSSGTTARSFNRLEYSGKEVETIASFFKEGSADVFLRGDATEENVKRNGELKQYNYVHFATHGLIDEKKPDLSSLVLSQNTGSGEDGFLRASEIFNLSMDADLVVLSACQTGLGKLVRGEGMVGLTRAFMYAGTPAVMVSLWSVSDNSTATLMGEFYKDLLKKKLDKINSLRQAKLTMLKDEKLAHPYYWAPFVIFGDWR